MYAHLWLMDVRSERSTAELVQQNKICGELNDYSYSGIWEVMDVPGQLAQNASKVVFNIVIRRKTLFYTVILIIPTVLMAFLSMMVFYLPAECSEKITLSISILLALVVFLLLVSKILPPTSDTIPLSWPNTFC
uniref:Acetylcholine receptor subunit beta-type acr-2 n=1 Tax=Ascaris suum TaxID=6253 RepID=F1LDP1_ASCSU